MSEHSNTPGVMRIPHAVVEDCWYSCPASGECCADTKGTACDCGADACNAHIERLEKAIDDLHANIGSEWRDLRPETRELCNALHQALHHSDESA